MQNDIPIKTVMMNDGSITEEESNCSSSSLSQNKYQQNSIDVMFHTRLDDFEHEEIIEETKWDNSGDFIDIDKVMELPHSANAFIVNAKGANISMQEAYYLPVSPDDNQCWEIQRDDKFLIEADQENSFDIYTGDFSVPNVLRVSVIQKTPQLRGGKDNETIVASTMHVSDTENLTESIWNDYTMSQLPSLENNLEHVISQDLIDTDIVNEQLALHNVENEESVAILQGGSDTLMVTCRCCNKNFSFYDLKLHIAEKSTEGYYACDRCTEIFLLKEDLDTHTLTHLTDDVTRNCEQCGAKLLDEAALVEHKKSHVPSRCTHCTENFSDVAELHAHVTELHTTKRPKTDFVEKKNEAVHEKAVPRLEAMEKPDDSCKLDSKPSQLPKIDEGTKIQIECSKCKEQFNFTSEIELDAYIKTHVPPTYYSCGFCDTIVTDKHEYNEHMKTHTTNSGNKFPYKCYFCDNLAFETFEELHFHTEVHVSRSSFICFKCSAQFVKENKRHEVVRIKHQVRKETANKLRTTAILAPADKIPTKENLKCKTCMAEFKKQDDFNKHVKTHIMPDTKQEQVSEVKVDPSYCAYCSSELLSIAEIIVHIRKHTEERKQFPCSNCDKKTNHDRSQNGSNHGGKENLCNYCLSKMNGNVRIHG